MKKIILFSITLFFSTISLSFIKPIPKRFFGNYKGVQASYILEFDSIKVNVPEVELNVILGPNELLKRTSQSSIKGVYSIIKLKKRVQLNVSFEDGTMEKWFLLKKPKSIQIETLNAIPEVSLFLEKN